MGVHTHQHVCLDGFTANSGSLVCSLILAVRAAAWAVRRALHGGAFTTLNRPHVSPRVAAAAERHCAQPSHCVRQHAQPAKHNGAAASSLSSLCGGVLLLGALLGLFTG